MSLNTGNAILSNAITVDSSYRVGIGTTSPSDKLNVVVGTNGNNARFDGPTSGLIIQTNASSADIIAYGGTTPAYRALNFSTSASTNMTITTAGNVGIGTSSPSTDALLHLVQNTLNLNLYLQNTNGSGKTWSLNSDNTGKFNIHDTTANYFTITGTGVVGIGTTDPQSILSSFSSSARGLAISNAYPFIGFNDTDGGKFFVGTQANLAYLWNGGTDAMIFATNNTERMRITASGNLGVGAIPASNTRIRVRGADQSSSSYVFICDNAVTDLFYIRNDGAFYTGAGVDSPKNVTTSNAANVFIDNADNGRLYRSTSSIKYKTDVIDYTKGLAEVMQIRPVFYKGKNDGDKQFAGLIAEEVHELGLTEFVQYAEDGTPDALAYSNMVALLVKAVQEQQAQIEELKAKIK